MTDTPPPCACNDLGWCSDHFLERAMAFVQAGWSASEFEASLTAAQRVLSADPATIETIRARIAEMSAPERRPPAGP